ncbi:glycosyltransferase 87 family protein [Flexivirga sp. B27]
MQQPGLLLDRPATGVVRHQAARGDTRQRRLFLLAAALVFLVGLTARLGIILRKGGIHGIIGYDTGVYFSGADALLHGRLPYRDFTMVHPPGITLAVTPFAALTHVMSDWHAFIVANIAFCIIGAANAVLVVVVCRRLGIARRGAICAGLFYAAWFGSVSAEFDVKLEPLGNLLLLLGLLALLRGQRRPTRWSAFLAGAVIGLPLAVKVWWIVPIVLILAWHGWCRHSVRAAGRALLGAAVSVSVVCLPFFLADPSAMWHSVVTGQLGRPRTASLVDRLAGMSAVPELSKHLSAHQLFLCAVVFVVFFAAVVAFAWRGAHRARFLTLVMLAQFVVLMAAPSWFEYYSDYLAVGIAVTVGAAAVAVRREFLASTPAAAVTAAAVVITSAITITGAHAIRPYAGATDLTRAVRNEQCVMSNNPTVLLRLDALSRGLANGCPNWIDVSGRLMGPDKAAVLHATNRTWHGVLLQYLRSGDAIALWKPHGNKTIQIISKKLAGDGIIARSGNHVIYVGGSQP